MKDKPIEYNIPIKRMSDCYPDLTITSYYKIPNEIVSEILHDYLKETIKKLEVIKSDAQKRYDHACEIEDGKWTSSDMRDTPSAELKTLNKIIDLLNQL